MRPYSPNPSDDIFTVIKTLLASRGNSTLSELIDDYNENVGDNRLPRNYDDLERLMKSIPDVECIVNDYGLEMWQVERSRKRSHYKYMKKDKPRSSARGPQQRSSSNKRSNSGLSSQGSSFGKSQPKPKRQCNRGDVPTTKRVEAKYPSNSRVLDMDGYFHNYQLMGDDFLLSLAKIDLGYKFTKDPQSSILRIGNCISGLTIRDLARIVRSSTHVESRVIVYIGTVDILYNHSLDSMINDYYDLVSAFRERGIEPILCTLAPIAEAGHGFDGIINGFNCWLTNRKWTVVDINKCFLDESGKTIRSVYQKDPRNVSGCSVRHLLWNKLGRQRVLKRLKQVTLGSLNL